MTSALTPTLQLATDLIRCRSVTPEDDGCQEMMIKRLEAIGFKTERLRFGEVDNFWAIRTGVDGDSGILASSINELARRDMFVVTGGSSSIRQFEMPCREAGAAARALLCQAAAARWDIAWEQCRTDRGFVIAGKRRLSFAELVVAASALDVPSPIPLNPSARNHLSGRDAPRLDLSAKVDGSASFAGDIRLPDMLFASVRAGPAGDTSLISADTKAGMKTRGVIQVVKTDNSDIIGHIQPMFS